MSDVLSLMRSHETTTTNFTHSFRSNFLVNCRPAEPSVFVTAALFVVVLKFSRLHGILYYHARCRLSLAFDFFVSCSFSFLVFVLQTLRFL